MPVYIKKTCLMSIFESESAQPRQAGRMAVKSDWRTVAANGTGASVPG